MKLRLIVSALLAALLLTGCNSGTPAETTAPADTTAAETQPAPTDIVLVGEGAPAYTILRGDNAPQKELECSLFLRKYLEKCGVKTKIVTDWEKNPVSEYEIVVGNTLRAEADGLTIRATDVGEEGYFIKAVGSRVYIGGGSAASIQKGVEYFLTEFFGYSGDPETASAASSVAVAGDFEYIVRQQYPISAVLVDGRDLREFVITWDKKLGDYSGKNSAENVQSKIYKSTGIWMEIVKPDEAGDSPVVLLSGEKADQDGFFTVTVKDGDLVMTTDLSGGIDRGFNQFFKRTIQSAEGEIRMDKNYKFEENIGSYVLYSEFGAKGDGKTNDIAAIIKAHEYANANNLEVRGDEGAVYYISKADKGAVVKTSVDWTGCSFIIDDSGVGAGSERNVAIFNVNGTKDSYKLEITDELKTIAKGQQKLPLTLPERSMIKLTEAGTKLYIRQGNNQNSGSDQTDILIADTDGTLDPAAPILWNYKNVTSIEVRPIDDTVLTLKGGTFTTIANQAPTASTYYKRGIQINRSNVVVDGLVHYVEGELEEHGAPYSGILVINNCADITVKNCTFTAHRGYRWQKPTGWVTQGSYDISPASVVNLTFENCTQTTDILDTKYWGLMGSNFCKNITLKNCTFSRFDAHQGVANVTIIGCTLGHQCLNAIGSGLLHVEDSTLYGSSFINLRSDYGSTWEGDLLIRNCTWIPNKGNGTGEGVALIGGKYDGFWNFGYECFMPKNITIEGLHVKEGRTNSTYKGIYLLGNITSAWTSEAYEKKVAAEGYPYHVTEKITISGFTSEAGKKWMLSQNKFMYRNVEVVDLDAAN